MYRYCAIYLFTIALLISCGSPLKTKLENMQPELDTAFYNKYIQKGPDANIYPIYTYASSQREPSEKFGTTLMMDGNLNTWWSSASGLNTGEHVFLEFRKLKAATCKIIVANDVIMARVPLVSVYINDSLYGNFASGMPIKLPAELNTLKIVAGETDGLNEVTLPIENDSTSRTQVTKKNIISRYNSRSFGIAEIEFYDAKGGKLPVKGIPVKKAIVQGAYTTSPAERFYMFDGNIYTSSQWFKAEGIGKMIITFPDFTPWTKLRLYTGGTDYEMYTQVREIGMQIGGKKEQKFTVKVGINELEMKEPFVARTYTFTFYKFEPGALFGGINEIQGFDGARWYNIEADSSFIRSDALRDSMANTPLKQLLNTQVAYEYAYTLLNKDTIIRNEQHINPELIEKTVNQKTTLVLRGNYTWEATVVTTTVNYGKKSSVIINKKRMWGDFKIESKKAEQVVLNVRYKKGEQNTVDGKPGKEGYVIFAQKMTITKTNVSLPGEFDMLVSY